jgi:hypothetical protein
MYCAHTTVYRDKIRFIIVKKNKDECKESIVSYNLFKMSINNLVLVLAIFTTTIAGRYYGKI